MAHAEDGAPPQECDLQSGCGPGVSDVHLGVRSPDSHLLGPFCHDGFVWMRHSQTTGRGQGLLWPDSALA